ncbi:MAG: Fe-S oxidoreductase [Gammaproteobacteria bacterium]|nr:Fe-S oxidoreductase [Gammaproteobacteria bacterium]
MSIGNLESIYRYPVKSMSGESLNSVTLNANGIPGDRAWAARDEVQGGIRGAKKFPGLMRMNARYASQPADSGSSPAQITLPNGAKAGTGDVDINEKLSSALEHSVTLWPLMPEDALDHYRRGPSSHDDMETELRTIFGRTPDEPLPDLSVFPKELVEFESPLGTYFDAFPLTLMTTQSLNTMQQRAPESNFDVRRFRPNLLINSSSSSPFPELEWIGKTITIGEAVIDITLQCPRCSMTTHGFDDLPKDPTIMRALVREAEGNLGVYATVRQPGKIEIGDKLR